jgi:hypothetical protein
MTDRQLGRFTRGIAPDSGDSDPSEAAGAESLGCFGWQRGNSRERPIMLELRRKDGHVMAVGYAWIERIEFKPEEGILLHLGERVIRITGSGLNSEVRPGVKLLDGLIRQRVPWIMESDRASHLSGAHDRAVVDRIVCDP